MILAPLHTPCELRGASAQRQYARCEFPVRRTVGAPTGLSTRIGQTQVADVTLKRAHYSAHYTAHYYRTIRLYVLRCKCGDTALCYPVYDSIARQSVYECGVADTL